MQWDPQAGHIPRGFRGGTGFLEDVRLVLVTAEPGNPYPSEGHPPDASAHEYLARAYSDSNRHVASPRDIFNWNLHEILDLAWPGVPFEEQMRRTVITVSVFCSASEEGATVPARVERECLTRNVAPHLRLFPTARIVALGRKAQRRLDRAAIEYVPAFAAAPPGSNRPEARASWADAVAGLS